MMEVMNKYEYPDFHYFYHQSSKLGWFDVETEHNYEKPPQGKLWIRINDSGNFNFASVYFNPKKKIYHTRLEVKIGKKTLTSREVPVGSDFQFLEQSSETVWYSREDTTIIKEIADCDENEKITVKLLGDDQLSFTLTKRDIIKIKDAVEVSNHLIFLQLSDKEKVDPFGTQPSYN